MNVCPECFADRGLKRRIEKIRAEASEGPCDFHPSRKGVPIAAVAAIVDPVFRGLYMGGPDDGTIWIDRGDLLSEVLLDLTSADDDRVIEGLIDALVDGDDYWPPDGDEPFYDAEFRYTVDQGDMGAHGESWADFRRSLMFDRRFFNSAADLWLRSIFKGVQQQRDADGRGPVYMIEPGAHQAVFFRARVANSWAEAQAIKDDLASKLGPPPEHLRRAGRLNPAGILAFYAAFDFETCVAELRPSVGGGVVAAKFKITEPICVLDTTRFAHGPKAVNLFAPHALERGRQWRFMQMFMNEIAKPIFPAEEHLEYLPTQAVAEFLNKQFELSLGGAKRRIDAIIFRSAQHPEGKNIVLLGDAAVVGEADGTVKKPPPGDSFDDWLDFELSQAKPDRLPRIVPDPTTAIWCKIESAQFRTDAVERSNADLDEEYD